MLPHMQSRARLAFVIAIALVLNAALPLFALAKLPDMQADAAKILYGEKMVVCTSDGFKVVDTKDVIKGDHEKPKKHCQSCYFNATFQPAAPDATATASAAFGGIISKSLFGFGGQQLQNQLYSNNLHTRAPPFFA